MIAMEIIGAVLIIAGASGLAYGWWQAEQEIARLKGKRDPKTGRFVKRGPQ